jgi:hypothetical protein
MTSKREAVIADTAHNIAGQIVDLAYLADGGRGQMRLMICVLIGKLLDVAIETWQQREDSRRRRA